MFRSQHKTRRVQTAPAGLGLFIGQHTTDSAGLAAAAIIMTVPALVVYVLLQRHFIPFRVAAVSVVVFANSRSSTSVGICTGMAVPPDEATSPACTAGSVWKIRTRFRYSGFTRSATRVANTPV